MSKLSGKEEVILAALNLTEKGDKQFTEWQLTVETWKLNKQRWGLPGYRDKYPDHKRVMTQIMTRSKNSIMTQGLMERVKTNTYKLTDAGKIFSKKITGDKDERKRADYQIYDYLNKRLDNIAFKKYLKDENQPARWLLVASFYGLSPDMKKQEAKAKMNEFEKIIEMAKDSISELGDESIRRTAKGSYISIEELDNLVEFHETMLERFSKQFNTLLKENKGEH